MKSIIKLFQIIVTLVFLAACNKEKDLPLYQNATASLLSASSSTIAPARTDSDKAVLTLNWTYPNHAVADPNTVKYIIEIDSTGKNFTSPLTKTVTGSLNTTYLAKELNSFLLAKGYEPAVAVDLDVRLTSSYSNNNERTTSNTVKISYTPYAIRVITNYDFPKALRVAGNFQDWSPASGPKLVDTTANGTTGAKYEGFINFNNASPEFKFVKGDDWSAGDLGGAGTGKLAAGGGANLTLPSEGVYRIKASTTELTWSFDKIDTWGLIGDATPGGWSTSTPMTMNSDGTYSVTAALTIGGLKFRANNDWAINFGDNKANGGPDNAPDYDGDNISITAAGNYLITLDLTKAGNYYYTVKKL